MVLHSKRNGSVWERKEQNENCLAIGRTPKFAAGVSRGAAGKARGLGRAVRPGALKSYVGEA